MDLKRNLSWIPGAAVAALLVAPVAQAQSTTTAAAPAPATGTTTTTGERVLPSWTKKITSGYTGAVYGAALKEPFNTFQPDKDTGETSTNPVSMDNTVSLGYKVTDTTKLDAGVNFQFVPVRGADASLYDPHLRLSNGKLINVGKFNVSAAIRYLVPVTKNARDNKRLGIVRADQVTTFDIPNSKWTLGVATTERVYAYYGESETVTPDKQKLMRLYAAPNVNYQLLDNLGFGLAFEAETFAERQNGLSTWHEAALNIEPGISWDITPNFNLNPWVDIPPRNVSLKTATWGSGITWKFF